MRQRSVMGDVAHTVGGYVVAQVKVASILACLYSLGYALSGVPYWFLLGLVSGALNVIPVVGSLLGLALTAYAVLLNDGVLWNYIGVLITFVVVQALEGFWLTPRIVGRRVGLSPLYVFVSILVGGALFGPLGVLLATPLLAVVAVLWRRSAKRRASV